MICACLVGFFSLSSLYLEHAAAKVVADLVEPTGCYFDNGKPSLGTWPCVDSSDRPTYLCCGAGHECLNNTLCAGSSESGDQPIYYRGTCIDPTWSNPSCPKFCLEDNKGRDVRAYQCGSNATATEWYCDGHEPPKEGACSLSDGYFTLSVNMTSYGQPVVDRHPSGIPVGGQDTPSSTSSLGQATQETQSAGPATTSLTETTNTTPGHDQTPSATAISSSTPQDGNKPKSGLAIGLGVGVGICVLIAATIPAVLYLRRKQKRKSFARASTPSQLAVMYGIRLSDIPGGDRYRRGQNELL